MENAEVWASIKGSFDESGMPLPEWFYQEERSKGVRQGGGRGTSNPPKRQRSAPIQDQSKGRTVRYPRALNPMHDRALNISGFKKKPSRFKNKPRRESTGSPIESKGLSKEAAELESMLNKLLNA